MEPKLKVQSSSSVIFPGVVQTGSSNSINSLISEVLPKELIIRVFSYLNRKDLLVTSEVCKRWCELSRDTSLWTEIFKKEGIPEPKKNACQLESDETLSLCQSTLKICRINGMGNIPLVLLKQKYQILAESLASNGLFTIATAVLFTSMKQVSPSVGKDSKELALIAYNKNDYVYADKFNQIASSYDKAEEIGLKDLIVTKINLSSEIEQLTKIWDDVIPLLDSNFQLAIQLMMSIVYRCVEIHNWNKAKELTQSAEDYLSEETMRTKARDLNLIPFHNLACYLIKTNQYDRAKECVEELMKRAQHYDANYLAAHIVSYSFMRTGILDESLLQNFSPVSGPHIANYQILTKTLLKNKKESLAKNIVRKIIDGPFEQSHKKVFTEDLNKYLCSKSITVEDWLKQK